MTVTELTNQGSVAVLTLTNGANKQNPIFAQELLAQLKTIEQNPENKALVITSDDEKNFSQGIDVDWLMPALQNQKHDEVRQFMYDMDEVFKTLLLFPMPVIAAINGHAFGNGAIMACACDFRFMRADKGFFCFPEVDLSIPFLPGMLAFIKKAIPAHRMNEMILTGRRLTGNDLAADNIAEQVFADDVTLMDGVMKFAAAFDKKRPIFAEHKKRMHKSIIEVIETENKPLIDNLQLLAQ
ncbi:MAG: enoyl-CoA hydratase/isomerase family protein [Alteromonadaceae bacterium]|nr:enoyl-CoA hydratase/isomerase family protein [Alteromonadaceae bacterium]